MYSVFVKIILNYHGNKNLCEHQGDKDAHKVYEKLSAHALKSTETLINSSKLLTYITSYHVGDVSWCDTTKIFILKWQDNTRLYETLFDSSDHFSKVQKRTIL